MPNSIPNFALCEASGKYQARRKLTEDQIIIAAKRLLEGRVCTGAALNCVQAVKDYLITFYANYPSEAFYCLFLDNQNRLLKGEVLFTGTVNASAVYPREVVRRCIELNAAAVIFAHNHPSGTLKASAADVSITRQLRQAVDLVGVRTLDHIVVAGGKALSFMETGLM